MALSITIPPSYVEDQNNSKTTETQQRKSTIYLNSEDRDSLVKFELRANQELTEYTFTPLQEPNDTIIFKREELERLVFDNYEDAESPARRLQAFKNRLNYLNLENLLNEQDELAKYEAPEEIKVAMTAAGNLYLAAEYELILDKVAILEKKIEQKCKEYISTIKRNEPEVIRDFFVDKMSSYYLQYWPILWPRILSYHIIYKFSPIDNVINLWDKSESEYGPVEMVRQLKDFQNSTN